VKHWNFWWKCGVKIWSTALRLHFLGTRFHLASLFEQLHNKSIQDDILASLTIIVRHLLEQNYAAADKAYYQMTRGKSPHPQIFSKDVPYDVTQWFNTLKDWNSWWSNVKCSAFFVLKGNLLLLLKNIPGNIMIPNILGIFRGCETLTTLTNAFTFARFCTWGAMLSTK